MGQKVFGGQTRLGSGGFLVVPKNGVMMGVSLPNSPIGHTLVVPIGGGLGTVGLGGIVPVKLVVGYLKGMTSPPVRLVFVPTAVTLHHSLAENVHSHLGDGSIIVGKGIHTYFLGIASGTLGMPYLVVGLGYQKCDLHSPGMGVLYESSTASAAIHIGWICL